MLCMIPDIEILSSTSNPEQFMARLYCDSRLESFPEDKTAQEAILKRALKKDGSWLLFFVQATLQIKASMGDIQDILTIVSEDKCFYMIPQVPVQVERQLCFVEPQNPDVSSLKDLWVQACQSIEDFHTQILHNGCCVSLARTLLPRCLFGKIIIQASFNAWKTLLQYRVLKDSDLVRGLWGSLAKLSPLVFGLEEKTDLSSLGTAMEGL